MSADFDEALFDPVAFDTEKFRDEPLDNVQAGEIVVVYSEATGRIRRVSISDKNGEIKQERLSRGELVARVSAAKHDLDTLQAALNVITGKTPAEGSDRYVIIDAQDAIVGALVGDPLCGDALPGVTLVQHAHADASWTYSGGVFTPPPPPPPKDL